VSFWAIGVCTMCYIVTALDFMSKGNTPMAIVFGGYSLANIGFLLVARQ